MYRLFFSSDASRSDLAFPVIDIIQDQFVFTLLLK